MASPEAEGRAVPFRVVSQADHYLWFCIKTAVEIGFKKHKHHLLKISANARLNRELLSAYVISLSFGWI